MTQEHGDSGGPAGVVTAGDAPTRTGEEYLRAFLRREEERKMALGICFRPGTGACQYEYVCVRCPYLQVDPERMSLLVETEVDALRRLRVAEEHGWVGEARAIEDTLVRIAEKKEQVRAALGA